MNGLADFVPGGFPLPWNPILADGLGDFVPGWFPLPQNPIHYQASVNGNLPKSPGIPRALIGSGGAADVRAVAAMSGDSCAGVSGLSGCGCGHRMTAPGLGGCGCRMSAPGLGAFDISTLIPGETFGINNTYLVGGVLAAILILPMMSGGRRRR